MENTDVFTRYSRQIFIEEVGVAGQRKIMQSNMLVIGAGGLGSPVIQYLAAAGVGVLGIADFDEIEIHNLNRQVLFQHKDVGDKKVDRAAHFATNINPHVNVRQHPEKITAANAADILREYDLVIDGSDNFPTRYLINDTCVALNKPLVYGSILGFHGQVSVFNFRGSKQLRDLFPEPPLPEDVPNCDKNGVLGPLPGIIGSMMAMQALKIVIDLPVDTDQLTLVDTLKWDFRKIKF